MSLAKALKKQSVIYLHMFLSGLSKYKPCNNTFTQICTWEIVYLKENIFVAKKVLRAKSKKRSGDISKL